MVLEVSLRWENFLNFSLLFFGIFGLDIGEYHSSAGQTWDGSMCQGEPVRVSSDNAKKMADEQLNYENYYDTPQNSDHRLR